MDKKITINPMQFLKKSKHFLFLFFLFFLVNCTYNIKEQKTDEKQKLANSVRKKAALKIKNEKSLMPFGTGGQIKNNIQMLALSFLYYEPLTMEEARELIIYSAQKLTDEINSETRIHPYLYQYPFSPTHTEIRICSQNKNHSMIPAECITFVALAYGIVEYNINDPQTAGLITIHQETYQEALEKLDSSKTELQKASTF
ncbi:MAG: hypothetical protein K2X69_09410 [Silvanigrellaceae bacterium]|nr:hypothetical protein [Silvanigrellaceae bacterium]